MVHLIQERKEAAMKKKLSILLAMIMVMSLLALTGCGSKKEEAKEEPKPTTAEELLEANKKAQKEAENYAIKGNGSAELKAASQGMEMTVPLSFDVEGAVSKDVIYGKGSGSAEMSGEKRDVSGEVFFDRKNKKTYSRTEEDGEWSSSELNEDAENIKFEVPESLKPSLEFSEADDAYVLECDLTQIDLVEIIKSFAEQQEIEQIDSAMETIESAKPAITAGKLTMKYEKDTCLLKSITVKEFAGSASTEIAEGQSMDIGATANIEFTFSDYGKVPAETFKLPEV